MAAQESVELELPPGHSLRLTASDSTGTLLIAASEGHEQTLLQVIESSNDVATQRWETAASWELESSVHSADWAHPEYGRITAVATSTGQINIYEQRYRHDKGRQLPGIYEQTACLSCGNSGIRQLRFGPRQLGLVLGVLAEDGCMYVFEADKVIASSRWQLHSKFQAGESRSCSSFCWRPHSPPSSNSSVPFLCICSGTSASVWVFLSAFNSWQRGAVMDPASSSIGEDDMLPTSSSSGPVHWAQPLGRPQELIAFASGQSVFVYAIKGDACSGGLEAEQVAQLGPFSDVHQLEFDAFGSQVGIADEQGVHVFRPDLLGERWQRHACIVPDLGVAREE